MYDLLTFCEKLTMLRVKLVLPTLILHSLFPLAAPVLLSSPTLILHSLFPLATPVLRSGPLCQLPCGPPAQLTSSALRPLALLLLPERPELTCIPSLVTRTSVTLLVSLARCQHSKLQLYLSLLDLALRNTPELVINKTMII